MEGMLDNSKRPERVGFGPRFAALIIDSFIVGGFFFVLFLMGWGAESFEELGLSTSDDQVGLANMELIMELVTEYIIYLSVIYGLIEGVTGAGPGKRILGLQIAREDGIAGETNLFLKRWVVKDSSNFIAILSIWAASDMLDTISVGVGLVITLGMFLIFTNEKQCLHDKLVRTAVYKKIDLKTPEEQEALDAGLV
jgi:uncharacterized RDD family membrane protein YckC